MCANYNEPEVLVLLSGGLDSTACLNFFLRMGRTPLGLFIDYKQRAVTSFYNVPISRIQWQGTDKGAGLILGRNAFLITAALMELGFLCRLARAGDEAMIATPRKACKDWF
jgi:7-cyano-7-deazaguanine synthase